MTKAARPDIQYVTHLGRFSNLWAFGLDWVFNLTSKWGVMLTVWNPEKICGLNKPISASIHIVAFSSASMIRLASSLLLRQCFCKCFRDRGGRQMGRLNCRVQSKIKRHNVALKRGKTLNWKRDGILIDLFSAPVFNPPPIIFPTTAPKLIPSMFTYSREVFFIQSWRGVAQAVLLGSLVFPRRAKFNRGNHYCEDQCSGLPNKNGRIKR